jgi:hypothetical protein
MSRLVEPSPISEWSPATPAAPRGYFERVAKYIPGEIVAAYVTMNGFISTAAPPRRLWLFAFSFGVCLALTPVYLARMGRAGQPRSLHLTMSTAAFVVWAYSLDGLFRDLGFYDPIAASLALVVFTLVSGLAVPRAVTTAETAP